jgi:hypothetical protein
MRCDSAIYSTSISRNLFVLVLVRVRVRVIGFVLSETSRRIGHLGEHGY